MPTVYMGMDVEEVAFIAVLRVVNALEGVAKVHFDTEQLIAKKRASKANGAAPPEPTDTVEMRQGLKLIIIKALFEGPKSRPELISIIEKEGYSGSSVNDAVMQLKRSGHVLVEDKLYRLTEKTLQTMEQHARGPQAAPALPAPTKTAEAPTTAFKAQGLAIILKFFAQHPGPVKRGVLRAELDAAGLPERTLDNAIQDGQTENLLQRVDLGIWKATAKGLKRAEALMNNG